LVATRQLPFGRHPAGVGFATAVALILMRQEKAQLPFFQR